MMGKYRFNMQLGHYVPLNEDVNGGDANGEGEEKKEEKPALRNLENDEVLGMKKVLQTKLNNIENTIKQKKDLALQVENKIVKEQGAENANQKTITSLQGELLQANADIMKAEFDKAKLIYDENLKILQKQKALLQVNENRFRVPEKYKALDESNIQNAKIHIDKLIKDDNMMRIKGMVDFKKVFSNSDLLYGKDKDGYFAVCVDQEDFNKLTSTLEETGFLRDEIIAHIMPQLFDRSNLTK